MYLQTGKTIATSPGSHCASPAQPGLAKDIAGDDGILDRAFQTQDEISFPLRRKGCRGGSGRNLSSERTLGRKVSVEVGCNFAGSRDLAPCGESFVAGNAGRKCPSPAVTRRPHAELRRLYIGESGSGFGAPAIIGGRV